MGAYLHFLGLKPTCSRTTEVCYAHGQCAARPAVTFPAAERYRQLTGKSHIPLRQLVRSWFGTGSKLVLRWFEPASVMEFGFNKSHCSLRGKQGYEQLDVCGYTS